MPRPCSNYHERFDGGYPSGLRGEDIPLEARIIYVADSFSVMISERPYRERMTLEDECAELERCARSQFDPEITHIFVEEVRRKPPTPKREGVPALEDDSELEVQRSDDEPILSYGTLPLTDNLTLLYTAGTSMRSPMPMRRKRRCKAGHSAWYSWSWRRYLS